MVPTAPELPTYAVVTPVKDEIAHLPRMAASMIDQTHAPRQWVIVDDGSTDGSTEFAQSLAREHSWITSVSRPPGGLRARGANVVEAFKQGLATVDLRVEFVCKLDGDLFLPAHYFCWVAETFSRNERAGIVGGTLYVPDGGRWELDAVDPNSVHGAVKAYRTACLDDIGGLVSSMGWDGIDEFAARARGWDVRPLTELQVLHYTPRGSKQNWFEARREEGRGNHFMGYRFPYLTIRALFRMRAERPRVLGGAVLWMSYMFARAAGRPQVGDALAIAQLQREHRSKLRALTRLRSPHHPRSQGQGPAFWAGQTDNGAGRQKAAPTP